jgi:branched-chain amino acid transport system permease protein
MGFLKKKTGVYYLINTALILLLFFVLLIMINTGVISRYNTGIITMICINVILAVSLNLVTGVLGQLVLGHAGFMLVGAYTAALFTMNSGLDLKIAFPIGLILAGLVSALFGIVIGIPALRLKGDYLAIITLGFGEIIRVVANNLEITNGAMGLSGIKSLSNRQNPSPMFIYAYAIAVLVIFIMFTFGRSRHGRAVIAIREDEIAAESMGINTTYYKLFAFVLAAFIAGVAGGIFAHQIGMIDPSKFNFNRSVEILIMVVLGGMGSITGSVISASVLTWLPEQLRDFSQYRMLVYSVILIIVMLFKPSGLFGRYEISVPKLLSKLYKKITKKSVHTKTGGA